MDLFNRQPKKPSKKSHKFLNNTRNTTEYTEERLAKDFGGKRVKGSGCSGEKGDISSDSKGFLIESKRTSNSLISIQLKHLEKIEDEAAAVGKKFLLISTFLNTDTGQPKDYVTLSRADFLELLNGKE